MKARWAGIGAVSLGLLTSVASAQDRPHLGAPIPISGVTLGRPVADDDAPPPNNGGRQVVTTTYRPAGTVVRAQCPDDGFQSIIPVQATFGQPAPSWPTDTISRQPVRPIAGEEGYNSAVTPTNPIPPPGGPLVPYPPPGPPGPPPPPPPPTGGIFAPAPPGSGASRGGRGGLFESDHCFDNFISPVTNPFLFEDPRASTEIRPVYIGQTTPKSNWIYDGGNINAINFIGSVAFNDRWSLTVNKFGWIWNDPHNGQGLLGQHVGFEELWLGPKYTFLRNENTGTVMAGGLIFQIPTGPSKVVQDTGVLTLTPYVTLGQHFLSNFNFMTTFGYALGTDDKRSDYLYNSYHLDYDVGGYHKIYPLVELNWFHYTTAGGARDFGFEGGDLINFGSQGVSGNDNLTMAIGARYRFNEHMSTGFATEFPLIASKDLVNFRFTLDFIYRF